MFQPQLQLGNLDARRQHMSGELIRSLSWVGLAIGIVAVFMVLEVLLRTLFNRYGTPAEMDHPHRTGTELPRVLKQN
jgi:N-acyl-L-homoserine lactone synthetase